MAGRGRGLGPLVRLRLEGVRQLGLAEVRDDGPLLGSALPAPPRPGTSGRCPSAGGGGGARHRGAAAARAPSAPAPASRARSSCAAEAAIGPPGEAYRLRWQLAGDAAET
ncbi:unnamed protein product, partial [Prorocentrum cordatum]